VRARQVGDHLSLVDRLRVRSPGVMAQKRIPRTIIEATSFSMCWPRLSRSPGRG
jgi:hypothetical protein